MSNFINTQGEQINYNGWSNANSYNNGRRKFIPDSVQGGTVLEKMGTSIPTPLARIFIFNTAFEEVGANHNDQTIYGKLVSECLDLLEFIYQFGSQIQVVKWGQADLGLLQQSQYQGHKNMYDAFTRAMSRLKYINAAGAAVNVDSIYLFFYNGALLGGTSPYTLVFTSPNLRRNLNGINAGGFTGLNGNALFPNYSVQNVKATPLNARSTQFQEFLSRYYLSYQTVLTNTVIGKYIQDNGNIPPFANKYNGLMGLNPAQQLADFQQKYNLLKYSVNGAATDVNILPAAAGSAMYIAYRKPNNVVAEDYKIKASRAGADCNILVLNEAGIAGAVYINGQPFTQGTVVSTAVQDPANRTLPGGMGVAHPYVYVDDFVEDYLIEMPYDVNSAVFHTVAGDDNKKYLLPLKPLFFKWFTAADINRMVSIGRNGNNFVVKLDVLVQYNGGTTIQLVKHVAANNVLNFANAMYGMALFPAYRVTNNAGLNKYVAMATNSNCDVTLDFMEQTAAGLASLGVAADQRGDAQQNRRYYSIARAFDAIQLTYGQGKALLVPKFNEVQVNHPANPVAVGIDFGTTNTYVYIDSGNAGGHTLDVNPAETQVMTLMMPALGTGTKSVGYKNTMAPGGVTDFYWAFLREFFPHLLGGGEDIAGFPYPTVICEKDGVAGLHARQLVRDISIGFNYLNESQNTNNYKYHTNIKWLLQTAGVDNVTVNTDRVRLFMEGLAWLIKNDVILNYNADSFTAYVTYPTSMGMMNPFTPLWEGVFNNVMGAGAVTVNDTISEAVAPVYHAMTGHGLGANTVNVDIGGGTTDILYIDFNNQTLYTDSSRFAGNDIWGDGIGIGGQNLATGSNGFFKLIDQAAMAGHIPALEGEEMQRYAQQKAMSNASADLMSYILKNDAVFDASTKISVSPKRRVLLVHLVALGYHIAQMIKDKNINADGLNIRFSGMGSKYISLIGNGVNARVVAAILNEVFRLAGVENPNLSVTFIANPKETTARGAVMAINDAVQHNIQQYNADGTPGTPEQCKLFFGECKAMTYGELITDDIIESYRSFVDLYFKPGSHFAAFIQRNLGLTFDQEFYNALTDRNATVASVTNMCVGRKDDKVNETFFFWPLKNALVNASAL